MASIITALTDVTILSGAVNVTILSGVVNAIAEVLSIPASNRSQQCQAVQSGGVLAVRHKLLCREALIQELRGSMHGLLDAFNGQQAEHYERRMRQLQTNLQGQLASVSLPETQLCSGALRLSG